MVHLIACTITAAAAECADTNDNCSFWASHGECQSNPGFMHSSCPVSCGTCVDMKEEDVLLVESTVNYGRKQVVHVSLFILCAHVLYFISQMHLTSLNLIVPFLQGEYTVKTLDVIRKANQYMQNDALKLSPQVIAECTNNEELCAFWAALGECSKNPEFMSQQCCPSCRNCGQPVVSACPPPGIPAAVLPGGIHDMFERIVASAPGNNTDIEIDDETMTNYTVQIISRPQEKVSDPTLEMQQHPWILSFDEFLTNEECDKLIELGHQVGYIRSHDTGEVKADGSYEAVQSDGRTSSGAFCSYPSNCRNDDVVQRIHDRIAKVTGIPTGNSEDLQILKYEQGEKYGLHHDYVPQQLVHQCGPRILTFFLYLSDVEDGGETAFTYLGISVKPKRRRALLWPSVFSSDPKQMDMKTAHEAKPVLKGKKYGANSWLHLYEYVDLPCGINLPQ